jgi:hypothetical protein
MGIGCIVLMVLLWILVFCLHPLNRIIQLGQCREIWGIDGSLGRLRVLEISGTIDGLKTKKE